MGFKTQKRSKQWPSNKEKDKHRAMDHWSRKIALRRNVRKLGTKWIGIFFLTLLCISMFTLSHWTSSTRFLFYNLFVPFGTFHFINLLTLQLWPQCSGAPQGKAGIRDRTWDRAQNWPMFLSCFDDFYGGLMWFMMICVVVDDDLWWIMLIYMLIYDASWRLLTVDSRKIRHRGVDFWWPSPCWGKPAPKVASMTFEKIGSQWVNSQM